MNHNLLVMMVDIETLGVSVNVNAPIISIGAVTFNLDQQIEEWHKEYFQNITFESACSVGVPDGSTIEWWLKQDKQAQSNLLYNQVPIKHALEGFIHFYKQKQPSRIFANSPSFDLAILRSSMQALQIEPPWEYWSECDYRTMVWATADILGVKLDELAEGIDRGVVHSALDDALYQARVLQRIFGRVRK